MPPWIRHTMLGLLPVVVFGLCLPVHAQEFTDRATVRTADRETNLFATLDVARPAEAFRLEMPADWTLEDATLLRYGATPVAVTVRALDAPGASLITTAAPIRGPHEAVIRVTTGSGHTTHRWSLVPVDRTDDGRWDAREHARVTERVQLEPTERPSEDNRALFFEASASTPLRLRTDALPQWTPRAPFTVECWLRTTGRDEVVLSTWNGDERDAYLLDLVVSPSGRLRAYFGRPGRHQSLVSKHPVADGRWHHAAVVYRASTRQIRLLLNGTVVDSLRGVTLPDPPRRGPSLTLGGRTQADGTGTVRFSGALDEIRVWDHARTASQIERTMRATVSSIPAHRFTLGFEDAAADVVARWPEGLQRQPSTRPGRPLLHDLRATVDGPSVQLEWASAAEDVQQFIIERSTDGRAFTPIARLLPHEVSSGPSPRKTKQFAFADDAVPSQIVFYRIHQVEADGTTQQSGTLKIGRGALEAPTPSADLVGNFPNPFTVSTTITYDVHEATSVSLTVWNLTGNRVARLVDDTQAPGRYEREFMAKGLPSGTYFVRMETPGGTQSHQMVLLK